MAKDSAPNKPGTDGAAQSGGRFGGPRTLASLLPAITRPAFKRRAPAAAAILSDWAALAGPAVAAMATPLRFTGGTLVLAASGPAATELQHGTVALMARLNAGLGRETVERIRFVQAQGGGLGGELPAMPAAPEPRPVPVAGIADEALELALGRLGGRVAARSRRD